MKKNQIIQPSYFRKYFFATVRQLSSRTRNEHALVLILGMSLFIGAGILLYYLNVNHLLMASSVNERILVLLLMTILTLFSFLLISQAFDVSLKINYNKLDTKKKLQLFNIRHGWRSGLINSIYFAAHLVLGYYANLIVKTINRKTFDYQKAQEELDKFYYYDRSELQMLIDDHSGIAIFCFFLLLICITMTTTVFTASNAQVSYTNKSGLESLLTSLRSINTGTWVSICIFRFIYGLVLIALVLIAYFIFDYFGQFGQFAGPGIALVGFYFLYPYVVALHTGFYFMNGNHQTAEQENLVEGQVASIED